MVFDNQHNLSLLPGSMYNLLLVPGLAVSC